MLERTLITSSEPLFLKKLGVSKRKKVFEGSMPPKLLVAASKLQRAPLPRVRVQPQISSSCDDDGGKMGGSSGQESLPGHPAFPKRSWGSSKGETGETGKMSFVNGE